MSGFEGNRYGLTRTKMDWWHYKHPHITISPDECQFCRYLFGEGKMEDVIAFLEREGFEVVKYGGAYAYIKISLKPYTNERGIKTTKEVDALYKLIAGVEEYKKAEEGVHSKFYPGVYRFKFGKFRGRKLEDIEKLELENYYGWMRKLSDPLEGAVEAMEYVGKYLLRLESEKKMEAEKGKEAKVVSLDARRKSK